MTTLETIRTAGKAITEAETELFLNKYAKSYMATKALLEVFHQVGRCKVKKIIPLETVLRNIELKESKLLNWC